MPPIAFHVNCLYSKKRDKMISSMFYRVNMCFLLHAKYTTFILNTSESIYLGYMERFQELYAGARFLFIKKAVKRFGHKCL